MSRSILEEAARKVSDTKCAEEAEPTHFVLVKNSRGTFDPLERYGNYIVVGYGHVGRANDIAKEWVERHGGVAKLCRANVDVRAQAALEPL